MTDKIGRNDECHCGSGKKYKKCCMLEAVSNNITDLGWLNIRKTEGSVVDNHLLPYLDKLFSPYDIETTIEEKFPLLPASLDKEIFFIHFIAPWLLFNWIPADDFEMEGFGADESIANNYLRKYNYKLSSNERKFIEFMNKAYYSFYTVIDVNPEKEIIVQDMLLGTTHTVKEKTGTFYLSKDDIIFSRILTMDKQSIFVGMAPLIIKNKKYKKDIISFKNWLIEENNNVDLIAESLSVELNLYILDKFFEIIEYMYYEESSPVNIDGEKIIFSKSYFKLDLNIEEAVNSLLPLTLFKKPDVLLKSADQDNDGKINYIEFPWVVKAGKYKDMDNMVCGNITIYQNKLILETNSEERVKKGKRLIKKYLGKSVAFQNTLRKTTIELLI